MEENTMPEADTKPAMPEPELKMPRPPKMPRSHLGKPKVAKNAGYRKPELRLPRR